jgi:hypothetical protein
MKKAVILIGHVRSFSENYDQLRMHFSDADFYFHALDLDKKDDIETMKRISEKDDKFFYEFFQDSNKEEVDKFEGVMSIYSFPTFDPKIGKPTGYSPRKWIKQVIDYKRAFDWFESFNKKYDLVIRIRPDLVFLKNNINYENIEKNKLYCFRQKNYDRQVNDKFFFSSQEILGKFMKGYPDFLKKISAKNHKLNAEELLYAYLEYAKLNFEFVSTDYVYLEKNKDNTLQSAGFFRK